MLPPPRELEFLKFFDGITQHLRSIREPRKALAHALRDSREFFQATRGCIAVAEAGESDARLLVTAPRDATWDLQHIGRFIRHTNPPARSDLMMAPVRRRGAAWAALSLMRAQPAFGREDRRRLARITTAVSEAIHVMDRERLLDVRDRIDRKIMEQIHPKDLFYQILDGVRSLTHYDHSSALLIRENGEDALRVVAEQIAWTKAKSHRIGLTLQLDDEVRSILGSAEIHGFDRRGGQWHEWNGKPVGRLAELLDYNRPGASDGEDGGEGSMLCAPLVMRDGIFGVLKVAGRHPGRLRPFDAQLVEHFRSQAAVAIQNLSRTESLQARMLTAERKHAIAELARTVSHDVNNAVGSMLPLIQQLQTDLLSGKMDVPVYLDDLYDYATMGGGRAALIIADVVGHGVSAAMLTGVVKSAFRASDADEYEPAAVVQRVRGNLSAFGPERFVTLIAAVLAADGELRYVNAGHPTGLLWSADGAIQRLTSTGPLVSPALPPCTWEQETIAMAPGDQLLLYTDGISDTLAGEHDLGEEPLVASIDKHREGGVPLLDALLSQVRARLAGRPQTDDLTLLTAKVLPRRVADRISGIRP